jgi:hypothetical protein
VNKAVEPPLEQAVVNAVELLNDIGALGAEEELTSLGRHLAMLPLNPGQYGRTLSFCLNTSRALCVARARLVERYGVCAERQKEGSCVPKCHNCGQQLMVSGAVGLVRFVVEMTQLVERAPPNHKFVIN